MPDTVSCRHKANGRLLVYLANTGLGLYALFASRMPSARRLPHTVAVLCAIIGALASIMLAKFWREASVIPPPADAPSAEPGPLPDDETISRDGRPIAVIRRGIMPDGRTVTTARHSRRPYSCRGCANTRPPTV